MPASGPVSKAPMEVREASVRTGLSEGAADSLSTRRSQVERLRNLDDATGWALFVGKYRGLIRRLAIRAGLREDEAEEVLQETLVAVARKMPEFVYDPDRCSFQGWIRHVTACRISDRIRRRAKDPSHRREEGDCGEMPVSVEEVLDERGDQVREDAWEEEWRRHLLESAMGRVEAKVKPEHFQMFRMTFLHQLPPAKVAQTLGVMVAQVYLVRHRLARLLKEEIGRVCAEAADRP